MSLPDMSVEGLARWLHAVARSAGPKDGGAHSGFAVHTSAFSEQAAAVRSLVEAKVREAVRFTLFENEAAQMSSDNIVKRVMEAKS